MNIKQIIMWLAIILVFAFSFGSMTTGYKDINVSGSDSYNVAFDSYTDSYDGIVYKGRFYKNNASDKPTNAEMDGSQVAVNKLFSKVLISKDGVNALQTEDMFWHNNDWFMLNYTALVNGGKVTNHNGELSKVLSDLQALNPDQMKAKLAGKRTGKFFVWLVIFAAIFALAFYSVKSQKHELKKTNPTVFMIQRFAAIIILFVILAAIGVVTDSPGKGVAMYAVFFAIVFALFFLSTKLSGGKDKAPNKTMFMVGNVLINVLLFIVMVCLVLVTDNPKSMFGLYFIFFLIVFGGIFASLIMKHKRGNEDSSIRVWLIRAIGAVALFAAVYMPAYTLQKVNFSEKLAEISGGALTVVTLLTAIVVAIGAVAVVMINLSKGIRHQLGGEENSEPKTPNKALGYVGYLILIVISCLPAIAIKPYDATSNTLGTVYFVAVTIAILSWLGISLITTKKR